MHSHRGGQNEEEETHQVAVKLRTDQRTRFRTFERRLKRLLLPRAVHSYTPVTGCPNASFTKSAPARWEGGILTPDLIRATQCPLSGLVLVAVTCRQELPSQTHILWRADILSVSSNVTNSKCAWLVKGDRSHPVLLGGDAPMSWLHLSAGQSTRSSGCSPKKTVMRPCMFHVHLSICQLVRQTGPAIRTIYIRGGEGGSETLAYCIFHFIRLDFIVFFT